MTDLSKSELENLINLVAADSEDLRKLGYQLILGSGGNFYDAVDSTAMRLAPGHIFQHGMTVRGRQMWRHYQRWGDACTWGVDFRLKYPKNRGGSKEIAYLVLQNLWHGHDPWRRICWPEPSRERIGPLLQECRRLWAICLVTYSFSEKMLPWPMMKPISEIPQNLLI